MPGILLIYLLMYLSIYLFIRFNISSTFYSIFDILPPMYCNLLVRLTSELMFDSLKFFIFHFISVGVLFSNSTSLLSYILYLKLFSITCFFTDLIKKLIHIIFKGLKHSVNCFSYIVFHRAYYYRTTGFLRKPIILAAHFYVSCLGSKHL